jgi:hypothetical protein
MTTLVRAAEHRTKKSAAAVSLPHLWEPKEQAVFKYLQAAIIESMTLAFSDPDKMICVLADASDRFYPGLMTQIAEEPLDLPMEEQDHRPLGIKWHATKMDSTREGRVCHCRHSNQGGLTVTKS